VFVVCKPILSPTGAWDPLTLVFAKITKAESLEQLQLDTIKAANGEEVENFEISDKTEPHKEETPPEAAVVEA